MAADPDAAAAALAERAQAQHQQLSNRYDEVFRYTDFLRTNLDTAQGNFYIKTLGFCHPFPSTMSTPALLHHFPAMYSTPTLVQEIESIEAWWRSMLGLARQTFRNTQLASTVCRIERLFSQYEAARASIYPNVRTSLI